MLRHKINYLSHHVGLKERFIPAKSYAVYDAVYLRTQK